MAIAFRRGAYADFIPSKLLTAEPAVVTSGDPNTQSGMAMYICFSPTVVKRLMTYEDTVALINQILDERLNGK